MKSWIRNLSRGQEFAVFVTVALAWPVIGSTYALLDPTYVVRYSDASLWITVFFDLLVLSMLAYFLTVRGWTRSKFDLEISLSDFAVGFALALASYVGYAVTYMLVATVMPEAVSASGTPIEAGDLSVFTILSWSVVNGVFEEVVVVGYVFVALHDSRSTQFAVNLSVGLRVLYHLYQGPAGVVAIVPMGLLFAFVFARRNKLVPLIIAHIIMDVGALLLIK